MMEREPYRPGLVRNKNLVEQLKEFQRNPRSLIFVSLAELYRAEGLPRQALDILEEGLSHHAGLPSALLSKARCYFDLRRFAEAGSLCGEILSRNPDNIKAQKLQADIFLRLGQRKAAIRALSRVVTLFPQDREAIKALEELENLETKVIVPVERLSRASVDSAPLGRIDEFQIGSFSESLASIQEPDAEPSLEAFEPLEPEVAESAPAEPTFATRTIAELYLRQGLRDKAMRVVRKILRDDPRNEWARETLQDLGSDEIVLAAPKSSEHTRGSILTRRARFLERLLAHVRMRRSGEGA